MRRYISTDCRSCASNQWKTCRYSTIIAMLLSCVFLGNVAARRIEKVTRWPRIAEVKKVFSFPEGRNASATVKILDLKGKPLYLLECHSAGYEGGPEFTYSGDFECRLISLYSKETYSTLLTESPDQAADWESRGRILAEELLGKCSEYPEYGRVRQFKLRGMKITLQLDDVKIREDDLAHGLHLPPDEIRSRFRSFRFTVTAIPDLTARSSIASPVAIPAPRRLHPKTRDLMLDCNIPPKWKN